MRVYLAAQYARKHEIANHAQELRAKGIALALDKRLIVCGPQETIFHYLTDSGSLPRLENGSRGSGEHAMIWLLMLECSAVIFAIAALLRIALWIAEWLEL